MLHYFINHSSKISAVEYNNEEYREFLELGQKVLYENNVDLIFELTESPIEKIFINSLVLATVKGNPLGLVVQHSVRNAPKQIQAFRETRKQFKKFISWYLDKNDDLNGIEDYLLNQHEIGKMEESEYLYLSRHLVLYEYMSLENRVHMIIQPGLPDILVEGKPIRPDLLFWIPSEPDFKVIVECDGFEYHKNKKAFVSDRKRDRALQANGYDILRYSGSEIYHNPVETSADITEYLWTKEGLELR